jgi:hypothetical protein
VASVSLPSWTILVGWSRDLCVIEIMRYFADYLAARSRKSGGPGGQPLMQNTPGLRDYTRIFLTVAHEVAETNRKHVVLPYSSLNVPRSVILENKSPGEVTSNIGLMHLLRIKVATYLRDRSERKGLKFLVNGGKNLDKSWFEMQFKVRGCGAHDE